MSEHDEQKLVVQWFRVQYPKHDKCLWAIPNGGARHIGTAIKLKREGVVAGVADLFLMIPKAQWHGMFIEMKAKGGKLQPNQKEFLGIAVENGYNGIVCYGFEEAKKQIREYLSL